MPLSNNMLQSLVRSTVQADSVWATPRELSQRIDSLPNWGQGASCALSFCRGDNSTKEVKICQNYNTSDPTCSYGWTFPLLFSEANTVAVGFIIISSLCFPGQLVTLS